MAMHGRVELSHCYRESVQSAVNMLEMVVHEAHDGDALRGDESASIGPMLDLVLKIRFVYLDGRR